MKRIFTFTRAWVVGIPKPRCLCNAFVRAFCASWLIVLGAYFMVPFYPVPMTLQTFFIALIALLAPWRMAMGAVLFYLSYAAMGIPVLAGGNCGIAALLGPRGGYFVGFVLMSGVIAVLTQRYRDSGVLARFGFTLIGGLLLFGLGLAHLAHFFGWEIAFKTGLLPFIFSEPTKFALAAGLSVFIQHKYLSKQE